MASISAFDSNFNKYHYDFKTDGTVLKSLSDSVNADTSRYEWTKNNELIWKENPNDTTNALFIVTKLNSDSLLLVKSKDSSIFYFSKLK